MKKTAFLLCAAMLFSGLCLPVEAGNETVELYVSTTGSDENNGSIGAPFKTLEGAKEYIRKLKQEKGLPYGGITVYVREGDYFLEDILNFNSLDSGTEDSPITYMAYEGEDVRLLNGKKIDKFEKVTETELLNRIKAEARDKLYVAELSDFGIEEIDEYERQGSGYSDLRNGEVHVFKNGEFADLARYPDEGYINNGTVTKLNNSALETEDGDLYEYNFEYAYDEARNWKDTSDIWYYGFPQYHWAYYFGKIESINPESGVASIFTLPTTFNMVDGGMFYFRNVFEELNTLNEYYIDREENKLYVISDNIEEDTYEIAFRREDMIRIDHAKFITLKGFTMSLNRACVVRIMNSENINIEDCIIKNNVNDAIQCSDTYNCKIINNEIYNMGAKGIYISDSDEHLEELRPNNYLISNNSIHDFCKIKATYQSAIHLSANNSTVSHNEIYNAPHQAMAFCGHYNIIEYNDIHDVLLSTEDAGAIYVGRSWVREDNIIRYNYIHDFPKNPTGVWNNNGVYLDDGWLGAEVYGNVFENMGRGVFCHGGRNNNISNNVFIDCDTSVGIINISLPDHIINSMIPEALNFLEKYPMSGYYFSKRYEACNDTEAILPKGNTVKNNLLFNSGEISLSEDAKTYGDIGTNVSAADKKIFEDFEGGDYTLKENAQIFKLMPEFERIEFKKIGIGEK